MHARPRWFGRLLLLLVLLPSLAGAQQLINGSRVITGTLNAATTTGTSTAYVLPLQPAISAYVDKQCFTFKAHLTNTGPATLNVNTVGAVPLKRYVGGTAVELEAGVITSGQVILVCWDGAAMQLVGTGAGSSGGGSGAVDTVFGRSGAVVAQTGDYTATQVTNAASTTAANVFTHANGQSMRKLVLPGSTSGNLTMQAPATAGTSIITWPPGSVDFTGTGGPGQVVKQVTSGAGLTVGSLTSSDVGLGNVDNTSDATKNNTPKTLTATHVAPRVPACAVVGGTPNTVTPNVDAMDLCILNGLTVPLTINIPTATSPNPRQGQYLEFRITSATPQALTWNATGYDALAGSPLPILTTGGGAEDHFGYKYNFDTTKWVLVASTQAPVLGMTTLASSTTYTCPATSNQCEMRMTSGTSGTVNIAPPSGTAGNGKMLMLRIMCTAASQTIAMTTGAGGFVASPNVPLLTSCPLGSSAWIAAGVIYSDFLNRWQLYATN